MIKRLIFLPLLFVVLSLAGQNNYVAINLGTSIPKNDFVASSDLFTHGYAVSGFSIEFEGVYFPARVIGLGGMLGFGSVYSDQNIYFDRLSDYINNHPDILAFTLPGQNEVTFSTGFWNYINFLAGPELAAPIWRFQIGIRAMGGLSLLVSPKRELLYDNGLDIVTASTKGSDLSLAYIYGGSIMYNLSSGTALKIGADYYSSKADYKFTFDADTNAGTVNESMKESINLDALQISLGLSYTF